VGIPSTRNWIGKTRDDRLSRGEPSRLGNGSNHLLLSLQVPFLSPSGRRLVGLFSTASLGLGLGCLLRLSRLFHNISHHVSSSRLRIFRTKYSKFLLQCLQYFLLFCIPSFFMLSTHKSVFMCCIPSIGLI
jgi:hypothetical protein